MDSFTFALSLVALLWTCYQQFTINRMCRTCPFFPEQNEGKPPVVPA